MAYIVGQYNHSKNSGDDNTFINLVTLGTASRYQGVNTESGYINPFSDECLRVNGLSTSSYYYFKCQVKRLETKQTFNLKLINFTASSGNEEQYIKTVTIQPGSPDEWVSVECIFHPLLQFDTILFQLERTLDDYRVSPRYPKIAYQELGVINNVISAKVKAGVDLLKIGVQSHPGLIMCINGEEIHSSKTGIYEIKNGILPISFFSVVNAATELTPTLEAWTESIGQQCLTVEQRVARKEITREQANRIYENMKSRSFLDTNKKIEIDSFTLDYVYEE